MAGPMSSYGEIAAQLNVRALAEAPLAPLTTMRVGGPAAWLFVPDTTEKAARAHAALREGSLPVRLLGGGSNVIVADEGIRAVVLATHELTGEPHRIDETHIAVPAGQPVPGLVRWAAREGLAGLEFAEGIPARLGGAIRMNAGANDAWFSDVAEKLWLAADDGTVEERIVHADEFGYRDSVVARERLLVLGAVLRLELDDPQAIQARIRAFRDRRRRTQPLTERSAGCVFANWPQQSVGALIDELGLKGIRIGDAEVSRVHANFIVNRGQARASDVLALIDSVREQLERAMGSSPRLEVEIWRDQ
ncbi:MAG: UDP-N-acetylmuramate dehydrogenase [Acidobacteriota bacterium]|nr:MAG: UDP-N-acetylmuramate dehydrogenase [Acidobacteriota bacterium]